MSCITCITNKMNTRSQTKKHQVVYSIYPVDIDFDAASACWRANKKACKNGTYKYVCDKIKTNGEKCSRVCYLNSDFCWQHRVAIK